MSMSLDGFIAGPNERPDNGLGDGGLRLHDWLMTGGDVDLEAIRRSGSVNGKIVDEFMATGATVAGRGPSSQPAAGAATTMTACRSLSSADTSRPLTSRRCPWSLRGRRQTAMTRAKQAAGDKNVLVHGAGTAQLALAAGVLDELELHVIPVLFGQGRRLFEGLAPEQIELQRTRMLEGEGGVTHMHYRVQR